MQRAHGAALFEHAKGVLGEAPEEEQLEEVTWNVARPKRPPTVSIFPNALKIGDRFTIDEDEWEVTSRPVSYKQGYEVRARIQRPREPGTVREMYWPAHERLTVRRPT